MATCRAARSALRWIGTASLICLSVVQPHPPLVTANPCPSHHPHDKRSPVTAVSQYQPVPACTLQTHWEDGTRVCQYSHLTQTYVRTLIPCGWDGTSATSTLVTRIDQLVTVSKSIETITPSAVDPSLSYVTKQTSASEAAHEKRWLWSWFGRHGHWRPSDALEWNRSHSSPQPQPAVRNVDYVVPYHLLGPLAVPGWSGSGLCGKACEPDEDGFYTQFVMAVDCIWEDGQTDCIRYNNTLIQTPGPSITQQSYVSVGLSTTISTTGTYTFTFLRVAPVQTLSLAHSTWVASPSPYYVHVTTVIDPRSNGIWNWNHGWQTVDFTTTVVVTVTYMTPYSTMLATSTETITTDTTICEHCTSYASPLVTHARLPAAPVINVATSTAQSMSSTDDARTVLIEPLITEVINSTTPLASILSPSSTETQPTIVNISQASLGSESALSDASASFIGSLSPQGVGNDQYLTLAAPYTGSGTHMAAIPPLETPTELGIVLNSADSVMLSASPSVRSSNGSSVPMSSISGDAIATTFSHGTLSDDQTEDAFFQTTYTSFSIGVLTIPILSTVRDPEATRSSTAVAFTSESDPADGSAPPSFISTALTYIPTASTPVLLSFAGATAVAPDENSTSVSTVTLRLSTEIIDTSSDATPSASTDSSDTQISSYGVISTDSHSHSTLSELLNPSSRGSSPVGLTGTTGVITKTVLSTIINQVVVTQTVTSIKSVTTTILSTITNTVSNSVVSFPTTSLTTTTVTMEIPKTIQQTVVRTILSTFTFSSSRNAFTGVNFETVTLPYTGSEHLSTPLTTSIVDAVGAFPGIVFVYTALERASSVSSFASSAPSLEPSEKTTGLDVNTATLRNSSISLLPPPSESRSFSEISMLTPTLLQSSPVSISHISSTVMSTAAEKSSEILASSTTDDSLTVISSSSTKGPATYTLISSAASAANVTTATSASTLTTAVPSGVRANTTTTSQMLGVNTELVTRTVQYVGTSLLLGPTTFLVSATGTDFEYIEVLVPSKIASKTTFIASIVNPITSSSLYIIPQSTVTSSNTAAVDSSTHSAATTTSSQTHVSSSIASTMMLPSTSNVTSSNRSGSMSSGISTIASQLTFVPTSRSFTAVLTSDTSSSMNLTTITSNSSSSMESSFASFTETISVTNVSTSVHTQSFSRTVLNSVSSNRDTTGSLSYTEASVSPSFVASTSLSRDGSSSTVKSLTTTGFTINSESIDFTTASSSSLRSNVPSSTSSSASSLNLSSQSIRTMSATTLLTNGGLGQSVSSTLIVSEKDSISTSEEVLTIVSSRNTLVTFTTTVKSSSFVAPTPTPSTSAAQGVSPGDDNFEDDFDESDPVAATDTAGASRSTSFSHTTTSTGTTAIRTASSVAEGTPTQTVDVTGMTYIDAMLMAHNVHRANHSIELLVWDASLASIASQTAATCVYKHDVVTGGGGYGQNIGAGAAGNAAAGLITNLMYNNEINLYPLPYGNNNPDLVKIRAWGHYSQIVWRSTLRVGCFTQYCPNGLANSKPTVKPYFTVCNYSPPGNYFGEFSEVALPGNDPTVIIVGQ